MKGTIKENGHPAGGTSRWDKSIVPCLQVLSVYVYFVSQRQMATCTAIFPSNNRAEISLNPQSWRQLRTQADWTGCFFVLVATMILLSIQTKQIPVTWTQGENCRRNWLMPEVGWFPFPVRPKKDIFTIILEQSKSESLSEILCQVQKAIQIWSLTLTLSDKTMCQFKTHLTTAH